jgi:Asp-tRNA(Asn)/Glu-tRNA(Gln) amidotransferase A subunit family amidase
MNDLEGQAPLRSAAEIARRVIGGEVSARDVLEDHLALIAEANPRLNAIVTLCEDEARRAAAEVDASPNPGSLQGVPFVVKDAIAVGGVRATAGSLLLEDFVPARDASAIHRLRQAGAVFIGKTNCPEFALDPDTENRVFGRTWNPVNEAIIPGGSSGGDAVAVAAGFAAFGLGSDYGGSIRWPAQCMGVVGFRPTVGLVPLTGLLPFPPGEDMALPNSATAMSRLNTLGPLTRSVDDAWKVLEVVTGPDGLDPNAVPVSLGQPDAVEGKRLACAWTDGEGAHEVRSDLVEVVEQAAVGSRRAYPSTPRSRGGARIGWQARCETGLPPSLPTRLSASISGSPAAAMQSGWTCSSSWRTGRPFSFPSPSFLRGRSAPPASTRDFANMAPCWAITLLGLPSLALPYGKTQDGLPVSVQIIGRPFADHEVVAVAKLLEQERLERR